MDSTTRRLRSFVALADTRHFGRAAEWSHISQQALSKQIAALEQELGVRLVERTTRSVVLTSAGEQFATTCRLVLETFDAGVASIRDDPGVLHVGLIAFGALELTDPVLEEFRGHLRGSELVTRQFTFEDPSAGLAAHDSDVAIVRLPIDVPDLRVLELFREPRVVAVSREHPLASAERVRVADLVDERLTMSNVSDEAYRNFWTLAPYRTEPMRPPIIVRTHSEELRHVAAGRAISITSACAARLTPLDGVVYVPVEDIAPTTCAIAWRAERENDLVRDFVSGARRVVARETDLVERIEHPQL